MQLTPAAAIELTEDDLGVRHGNTYFPSAGESRQIVKSWEVTGFGKHPRYFLTRDLLFASQFRDKRNWKLRKMCGEESATWLWQGTEGMPMGQRKLIRQYRAFYFLHICHLLTISKIADENLSAVIKSLIDCWPQGVMVQWTGPGQKTERDVCRNAAQCPWCFARLVIKLHDNLLQTILASPGTHCFALATVNLPIEFGDQRISSPEEFRAFQTRVRKALICRIKSLGAEGGIVTTQIGPRLLGNTTWENDEINFGMNAGLECHFGVLGTITRRSDADSVGNHPANDPIHVDGFDLQPNFVIRAGEPCRLLRLLLAGHSWRYTGDYPLPEGRGVFRWPSLSLSNYAQWRQHHQLTRGMHLFNAWGTWKGSMSQPRRQRNQAALNRRLRAGRYRQTHNKVNDARANDARDRRDVLANELRGIWVTTCQNLGGAPGRERFGAVLSARGVQINERDLRAIVKKYKSETTNAC